MKTEFIAEGAYGCVLKPAKECDVKLNKKKTVVKIFRDKEDYITELNNQDIIEKLFKNNKKIIVNKLSNCKKKINEYDKSAYIHCKDIFNGDDNQEVYQIVYENGGEDLWKHVSKNNITFKKIFLNLENVINGLEILQKKNYIHQDIRPPNILLNFKNKESKIIDFGFLIKKQHFYNYSNKFIRATSNHQYPPEANKNNYIDFFEYFKNLILRHQNFFISDKKRKQQFKIILYYLYQEIRVYKKYKIPKKINLSKFDVYMLGISLFDLFITSNFKKKLALKNAEFNLILNFIKNLLNFNINKRYSIKKTKSEYNKLCSLLKKK